MVRVFTCEQFYELVWSRPTTHLAKEFAISDPSAAPICSFSTTSASILDAGARHDLLEIIEEDTAASRRSSRVVGPDWVLCLPHALHQFSSKARMRNQCSSALPPGHPSRSHSA